MKQKFSVLLFLVIYMSINYVECQQLQSNGSADTVRLSLTEDDNKCPFWHFYNPATNTCECYNNPSIRNIVKCTEYGIAVRVGYCMTSEEQERTIYIASCAFITSNGNFMTSDNGRYIELPVSNVSELNTHMCGPMNRKGRLCSECVKGFGPSIISSGLECSDCTGAWYGVPLYLFLEFMTTCVGL
jgi:hypothetical protein